MTAQPQMLWLSKADIETPVPAEVHLALLVPTRARQADTARRRTPLVIAEGTGPFLPSVPEAGATAVHAGATSSVKSLDAWASPSRHRSRGHRRVL